MLRRCILQRSVAVILAATLTSLVVSVTLFAGLLVEYDVTSVQPCVDVSDAEPVLQLRHPLAGNEVMQPTKDTEDNAARRSDDDEQLLLRFDVSKLAGALMTSQNQSLTSAREHLKLLRLMQRRLEHKLDVYSGPSAVGDDHAEAGDGGLEVPPQLSDVPDDGDPEVAVQEPMSANLQLQQQQLRQREHRATETAALRGLRRIISTQVDRTVVGTLKDIVSKCLASRRTQPPIYIRPPVIHKKARTPWHQFHNHITQYELYSRSSSYVDELVKNLARLEIVDVYDMSNRGTQLKLILKLDDGTKLLFKPMRISKDVEANPNHFVFNEMERHHSEIAAFHLDRLLDFRRVPPVAGRYINVTAEIRPFADKHLNKTFFTSPAGNQCFYGDCTYYCDSHHAVCGNPDIVEGSCASYLPSEDDLSRKIWQNPWAQLYTKRNKLPKWKTAEKYCDEVRSGGPYNNGRRLLDVIDIAIFDFLIGNLDRHHYYTFEDFNNFTFPILTDNGRGFGRAHQDDIELLAPIYQCCVIRASTFIKLVQFLVADFSDVTSSTGSAAGGSLSAAMRSSLANDVIRDVLNDAHLSALDRRVRTTLLVVYDCLNRTMTSHDFRRVVIDDGF